MTDKSITPMHSEFRYRGQFSRLAYVTGSRRAIEPLAEQYSGLPL